MTNTMRTKALFPLGNLPAGVPAPSVVFFGVDLYFKVPAHYEKFKVRVRVP